MHSMHLPLHDIEEQKWQNSTIQEGFKVMSTYNLNETGYTYTK